MNARFCLIFLSFLGLLASCAPSERAPIPVASERSVLVPSGLAVLEPGGSHEGQPGSITFGSASGRSALYLCFPPEWRAGGTPARAFIALEPREDSMPSGEPVRIEAWRVRNAWRPHALHDWSDKPELAPPYAAVTVTSSPATTLRLDVTELMRFAAHNPELDHGIALIAVGGSGHGVSFSTGVDGGAAPRLEVYSR